MWNHSIFILFVSSLLFFLVNSLVDKSIEDTFFCQFVHHLDYQRDIIMLSSYIFFLNISNIILFFYFLWFVLLDKTYCYLRFSSRFRQEHDVIQMDHSMRLLRVQHIYLWIIHPLANLMIWVFWGIELFGSIDWDFIFLSKYIWMSTFFFKF